MTEVWGHCSGTCDIIGCLWKKQLISNKCCCTSRRECVPRAAGSTDSHISACRTRRVLQKLFVFLHTRTRKIIFMLLILTLSMFQHVQNPEHMWWMAPDESGSQREAGFYEKHAAWNRWCHHWSARPNFVFLMGSWTLFELEKWKRTANDVLLHNTSCQRDS